MPIGRIFRTIPQNVREWANWFREAEVTPDDGSIGDNAFQDRSALSIIGNPANAAGTPRDIAAGANNQFLVRRSSALVFDSLVDTDIPSTIARDTEVAAADAVVTAAYIAADVVVTAAAASALSAHVAAADPHTGYRLESVNVPWAELSGVPSALLGIYVGTGSPEGVLTASVGSLYRRTDGGAGTCLYVKESGSGSSGWVAK